MPGAMKEPKGKMGFGVLRYSPNPIACVIDPEHAGQDAGEVTGIPRSAPIVSSVAEARALGAEVLLLGIAPPGGLIPPEWFADLDDAVAGGMSLVNGLHDLLTPRYPGLPTGQWVWDIRVEPPGLAPSSGKAMQHGGRRLLMIGTDMAVGKMTAGLELWQEARQRGIHSEFIATGQIGITIMGSGVPLDAVRIDFAAGSIEREILRCQDADLIVVEGQGSLVHPASSATLPLLRGSMPTHLVMCHRAGQDRLVREPRLPIPPLGELISLYEALAGTCGTFPAARCVGVFLNTSHLSPEEAEAACQETEDAVGMPCQDPVRHGTDRVLAAVLAP